MVVQVEGDPRGCELKICRAALGNKAPERTVDEAPSPQPQDQLENYLGPIDRDDV